MKKKIFILLLVFVALFTFTACGKKSKKKDRSVTEAEDAFFIKDGEYYALFSKDGKQLTKFEFTYAGSMINGTAVVEKDDVEGIINSKGKMVVDFGKYKSIYSAQGLYKATDEKYNKYLLNNKGKQIADLNNNELLTYTTSERFSILYEKENGKYKVLDPKGDTLVSFNAGKDDEPAVSSENGFLSVHYDNTNYIIDLVAGKKLLEFDAKEHYCINVVSNDGKRITLNSCVKSYESQDTVKYKFIDDGKIYDLSSKCEKVTLSSDINFICIKDYKEYLIDSNHNVGIEVTSAAYKDNDHYAKAHNGSFEGIDFYEKDKVVKNVACRSLSDKGYSETGIYLLSTYYSKPCGTESGTYEFYNEKGEKAFDKSFARANGFDKNSIAVVSEDKENYYLIDTKGKKLTGDYDSIYTRNYYYEVRKDGKEGAVGADGKLIVDAKYDDIWEGEYEGEKFLVFNDETAKKYTLYSIDKGKEIATFNGKPSLYDDCIHVSVNGKTEYYTYTGKKIYASK